MTRAYQPETLLEWAEAFELVRWFATTRFNANGQRADDLTQEACIALWKAHQRYDYDEQPRRPIGPLATTIIIRTMSSANKTKASATGPKKSIVECSFTDYATTTALTLTFPSRDQKTAVDHMSDSERREEQFDLLKLLISELPDKEPNRQAVMLVLLAGKPVPSVAEELGVPTTSIVNWVHRYRLKARKRFEELVETGCVDQDVA